MEKFKLLNRGLYDHAVVNEKNEVILETYFEGYASYMCRELNNGTAKRLFYRVSNVETQQGLWYDFEGNFTGLIHSEFSFCKNSNLPMEYDESIAGWLSATQNLDDLFDWFTPEDIKQLETYGYRVSVYEALEFREFNNHWLIKQKTSKLINQFSI